MTVSVENDGREAFYERDNRSFVEVATDSKVKELEARRDELLEALKALLEVQQATKIGFKEREAAIAAISKAEGGE